MSLERRALLEAYGAESVLTPAERVMWGAIDAAEEGLAALQNFILPGGSAQAAHLHHARTVCRRAERAVLAIDDASPRAEVVIYLNRLSDLLFTLARRENHERGVADIPWAPRA